jgi:hypothetical protein
MRKSIDLDGLSRVMHTEPWAQRHIGKRRDSSSLPHLFIPANAVMMLRVSHNHLCGAAPGSAEYGRTTTVGSSFRRFTDPETEPKRRALVFCLALTAALGTLSHVQAQVDITERVRRNTPLSQTIHDFCATYCQGNKREGRLMTVTLRLSGQNRYRGVMTADLRNCQELDEPFNVTVFDWTIRVRTEGLLDISTCTFVVESVTVDDDPHGLLAGVFGDPRGRKVQIPNCRRLLP